MPLEEVPRSPPSSFVFCFPSDSQDASVSAHNVLAGVNKFVGQCNCLYTPPYKPAVTSARKAERVSRAIIRFPTAACIGTSNNCLGMTLSSYETCCQVLAWKVKYEKHTKLLYPGSSHVLF